MSQKSTSPSNKTWIYVGGAVLAVLVAVLIAFSVTRGGDKDELTGVGDITTMLKGIPSKGLVLGKETAPVTIIEFIDPQCPHCAEASKSIIPDLVARHVRTGDVKLQLAPIAFISPTENGQKANRAIWAAGQQGKAWTFTEVLFHNQGAEGTRWLDDGMIDSVAGAVGLDKAAFDEARGTAAAQNALEESMQLATANKVSGTPTFLARNTKTQGQVNVEDLTPAGFDAAIAAVAADS